MIKKIKGFTLIELLVVISIIGILAGLGTARYLVAQKHARDTQRKSDLNQYRVALENYASANNSVYPSGVNGEITALCDSGFATDYLSGGCINDVMGSEASYSDYVYYSDGIDYVLGAQMEVEKDNKSYYEVCSTGRSGFVSSLPNDQNCDL